MFKSTVFNTIKLANYFESAFSIDQVYQYLPSQLEDKEFKYIINQLENENEIKIKDDLVFQKSSTTNYYLKKKWSRSIFKKNKKYISIISKIPWIKFIGLTGANSFESCKQNDDVDMFVVTQKNKLWLTYLFIVVISKLLGKRNILCVNYLVDDENLTIRHKSYYNAVQILQMKSIFNPEFRDQLIYANKWIFDFLPNAVYEKSVNNFYLLNKKSRNGSEKTESIFARIDNEIYKKYSKHLRTKYTHLCGKSLIMQRGIAKLHRQDNQDIYSQILEPVAEANNFN